MKSCKAYDIIQLQGRKRNKGPTVCDLTSVTFVPTPFERGLSSRCSARRRRGRVVNTWEAHPPAGRRDRNVTGHAYGGVLFVRTSSILPISFHILHFVCYDSDEIQSGVIPWICLAVKPEFLRREARLPVKCVLPL